MILTSASLGSPQYLGISNWSLWDDIMIPHDSMAIKSTRKQNSKALKLLTKANGLYSVKDALNKIHVNISNKQKKSLLKNSCCFLPGTEL